MDCSSTEVPLVLSRAAVPPSFLQRLSVSRGRFLVARGRFLITRGRCSRGNGESPRPPQPISPHGCNAPVRMVRGTAGPALTFAPRGAHSSTGRRDAPSEPFVRFSRRPRTASSRGSPVVRGSLRSPLTPSRPSLRSGLAIRRGPARATACRIVGLERYVAPLLWADVQIELLETQYVGRYQYQ